MRYYFQSRIDAQTARSVVAPKLADNYACELHTYDAGYALHVYETSGSGHEYDLSGEDLKAFGVWA